MNLNIYISSSLRAKSGISFYGSTPQTPICIRLGRPNIKMVLPRAIGQRLKMSNSRARSRSTVGATGRKLLRPCQGALTSSACIAGKRSSTPHWSKGPGVKRKTNWSLSWCKKKALKSGLKLQRACRVASASSAVKDGTTILTQELRSAFGLAKKSGFCSWHTGSRETSGLR